MLALAAGLLGGCTTFERRAREKAEVFATLSPETRARLENKSVEIGDTEDMVFIAFGRPDETESRVTAAGSVTTWTYNRYWQEYQGEAPGGLRRVTVRDPKTGTVRVYYEQISRPVYASREQPVLRVTFEAGKVAVFEQAKP